jgi:hypothetical protein
MSDKDFDFEGVSDGNSEDNETIIEALRTEGKFYQTLRHLTIHTKLPADRIEPFLRARFDIVTFQMVGVLQVWFLREKAPKGRLYNTGYNSFAVVEGDVSAPTYLKTRQQPYAGTKSHLGNPKSNTPRVTHVGKLDLVKLEQFGFEGKTIKEVAAAFGIPFSTTAFYLYTKDYPQYGAAYRKGKQRRRELQQGKVGTVDIGVPV